jgi:hypothetical protein
VLLGFKFDFGVKVHCFSPSEITSSPSISSWPLGSDFRALESTGKRLWVLVRKPSASLKTDPALQGLWGGMIGGTLMQTLILIWITFRTDGNREVKATSGYHHIPR